MELPFDQKHLTKVSNSSGIQSRHIASKETTASDLCLKAGQRLIEKTGLDKSKIGVLVFVTQYPDYLLPSTVHIIKQKLDLGDDVVAMQLNEGCSGYIYGLQLCLSLLQSLDCAYGLLFAGDTTSKVISSEDTGTRPLFGDAGSATLIVRADGEIKLELGSDGSGYEDIIVKNFGFRDLAMANGPAPALEMDGMNVYMFGISRVPKYIQSFIDSTGLETDKIDFFVMHQANKLMNDRIVRKLKIEESKALYSLEKFGNTSSASIPLTITHNLKSKIQNNKKVLACGFGVGLSWGTAVFDLNEDCLLETIVY